MRKKKCPSCKSIYINHTFCSNIKCKSWKLIRAKLNNVPPQKEHGLSADDPITLYCPICDSVGYGFGNYCYCNTCKKTYEYDFKINYWYRDRATTTYPLAYITQYVGKPNYWSLNGQVRIYDDIST